MQAIDCSPAQDVLGRLQAGSYRFGRRFSRNAGRKPFRAAHPNITRQIVTEATMPMKSANKPAATACRVRRMPTEPK